MQRISIWFTCTATTPLSGTLPSAAACPWSLRRTTMAPATRLSGSSSIGLPPGRREVVQGGRRSYLCFRCRTGPGDQGLSRHSQEGSHHTERDRPELHLPDEDRSMPDEPVVLTVGRLERYKNVDLIIDAFRALPSSAMLIIVGDGPDRSRLERHAETSEPGWPVHFTGRISDSMLDRWFAHADVVTSASDHEAFGITLAEGLASGARVVASAIPAYEAASPPGRCGRSGHSRRPAGHYAVHRLACGSLCAQVESRPAT